LRKDAEAIWWAAVEAVKPQPLLEAALRAPELAADLGAARHIVVVGAGKASAAMAEAFESAAGPLLDRVTGVVNVPAETVRPLRAIRLCAARPAGSNHPTAEGVAGTNRILELVEKAEPDDVVVCLLSGGGSALLPAPVLGVSLEDKQLITKLLHACGATINEMNAVRKHLSRIKGGGLVRAFHGKAMWSLIISDVIGDPLDVIASGPTAADPTTFADALGVLSRYGLPASAPAAVLAHLTAGARGEAAETLKVLPKIVHNRILANNALALAAAAKKAEALGYNVVNLGSFIEGETRQVAVALAGIVRGIQTDGQPLRPPVCVLSGGETTVTLGANHGRGGRNQEFVLAAALKLGPDGMRDVVLLSGGTDGEDGPTDAAGAVADYATLERAKALNLSGEAFLARNDAYSFFEATGDLLKSGLTQTNVMDVRVFLIGSPLSLRSATKIVGS
jgi:hydroxypyruvate reductase/glycerate 2-kinase